MSFFFFSSSPSPSPPPPPPREEEEDAPTAATTTIFLLRLSFDGERDKKTPLFLRLFVWRERFPRSSSFSSFSASFPRPLVSPPRRLGKKKRPQQIFFFFVSIERYPSCRHYSHRDDEKRNNAYRTPRTKEMVKRFPAYSPIGCDVLNLSFQT